MTNPGARLDVDPASSGGPAVPTTPTGATLSAYLNAFDALDPKRREAWVRLVEDSGAVAPDLGESGPSAATSASGELAAEAAQTLIRATFGESTHSDTLTTLIERALDDRSILDAGEDFERRALRELLNVAKVVPHRLRLQHEDAEPATPANWGKFTLLAPIDSGGFGTVYRAWDPDLEHTVALKLYHPHRRRTKDELLSEARKLARVRHPNVVVVHGADEHVLEGSDDATKRVGVWMELIEGETLRKQADQRTNLSAAEAIDVGVSLCEALEAVHAAGIIHADIKAHNIMAEAGTDRLVVMDFGAARFRDPDIKESKKTLAGTKQYMAPELFFLEEPSVESDIYALGVLLFYLVSGKYPVLADTEEEIKKAHETGARMVTLKELRPDLDETFVRVVERAIARSPKQRWASASRMRRALLEAKPLDWLGAARAVVRGEPNANTKLLQASVVGALIAIPVVVLSMLFVGYWATNQFEVLLRITPEFRGGPGVYRKVGYESFYAMALMMYFALAMQGPMGIVGKLVWGSTAAGLAGWTLTRWLSPARAQWLRGGLRRVSPRVVAGSMLAVVLGGWAVLRWSFQDVFASYRSLTYGSTELAYELNTARYVVLLAASGVLVVGAVVIALLVFPSLERREKDYRIVRGLKCAMLVAALFIVAFASEPRRFVWESYPVASYEGRDALVVGSTETDVLLLWPEEWPRGFQAVPVDDPDLARTGRARRLFFREPPPS